MYECNHRSCCKNGGGIICQHVDNDCCINVKDEHWSMYSLYTRTQIVPLVLAITCSGYAKVIVIKGK